MTKYSWKGVGRSRVLFYQPSSFIYGVRHTDLNLWNDVIWFILFCYEPKQNNINQIA